MAQGSAAALDSGGSIVVPGGTMRRSVVLYQAEWPLIGDGVCTQARRQVVALASTGLRVGLIGISYREASAHPAAQQEVASVRYDGRSPTPIGIRQTVIHNAHYLDGLLRSRRGLGPKQSVVATWWERDRAHPDIVSVLNRCAELWVACSRSRSAFIESGVPEARVHVVPYPLPEAHPAQASPVPEGKRFYNIGKWEPRKNQHGLIGAFLCAYRPGDNATLTVKTRHFSGFNGYPDCKQTLGIWAATDEVKARGWGPQEIAAHVRLLVEHVDDSAIAALHAENNIYVSASFGEGLDIPALEAKQAGNRLVHVGFGGSEDYAEATDIRLEWRLGPVDPSYRWEPGAQWAKYEHAALIEALAKAEPRENRENVTTLEAYRATNVGQLMRKRLEAVFGVAMRETLQ